MSARLVGASMGNPYDPHTASGVAHYLFEALQRRYSMAGRIDAQLRGWQRLLVALATWHPSRDRWRQRYHKHPVAAVLRSANTRTALAGLGQPYDAVVQVWALFQTLGAPYLIYADNTHHLTAQAWAAWSPFSGVERAWRLRWERHAYHQALHIFAVGQAVAESLVSFYGVPAERVSVVGGGVNFERLPELDDAPREPVVLFVGKDYWRKGGDRLVEAFRVVRAFVPAARLQIVGNQEAPDEPGVEVLGMIRDRQRLAELYARASVFCLPSRFEPYGFSFLEAMAYGLPCIGTTTGAVPEVIVEGRTGLLVLADDSAALAAALLRLLKDPTYAASLGAAGRQRVERELNWDRVVERMAPVLDRLPTAVLGSSATTGATRPG